MGGDIYMHNDADVSAETSDGRWLTYDQLAALRRIDKPSAVKLATRNRWQRRKSNTGQMQVCVPLHWFDRAKAIRPHRRPETRQEPPRLPLGSPALPKPCKRRLGGFYPGCHRCLGLGPEHASGGQIGLQRLTAVTQGISPGPLAS